MTKSVGPSSVSGSLRAPASKSSMQRAIACAALAKGESILRNPSLCADSLAALSIAHALGASVIREENLVRIRGTQPRGLAARNRELSCGESGLCIRMFTPIAALFTGNTRLLASGSLRKRPVAMLEGCLESLGASCRSDGGFPPVDVVGPMLGGYARVDGSESSQFITGLLIALSLAERNSTIIVENMVSSGYVDLTLATMAAFGVHLEGQSSSESRVFAIQGGQSYSGTDFTVEGDWSGAAFLLVAGAIAAMQAPITLTGLSLDSCQPDAAIIAALKDAGAIVESGPSGLNIAKGHLDAFAFDARNCPDLFPPLVALAAACKGDTRLSGVHRLKHKESDRALALQQEFGKLGVDIKLEGDEMIIRGGTVHGGTIDPRGDHRIAMAAATVALIATETVRIEGAECVAKSWPGFFEDRDSLTG